MASFQDGLAELILIKRSRIVAIGMSGSRTFIFAAALIAAFATIVLQHKQNKSLTAELAAMREEKARLESEAATSAKPLVDESGQKRVQALEWEVTRLRGAAGRATRAESENEHLK